MKTYVRVTISHKGNYEKGIARHLLIDLSEEQINQIFDAMRKDRRPIDDHCCMVFTDEAGMGGGRWNAKIQEIVEKAPVFRHDECRRGNRRERNELHKLYCKLMHE